MYVGMQMAGIAMANFDMDTVPGRLVIPKTVCKGKRRRKEKAISGASPPADPDASKERGN
jgi:hypothetical protein